MGRVIAKIRLGKGVGGSKLIWIGSKKGRKFDLKRSRLRPSFWAFLRQNLPDSQKNDREKKNRIPAKPVGIVLAEVRWLDKKKKRENEKK